MNLKPTALALAAIAAVSGCKKHDSAPSTPAAAAPAAAPVEAKVAGPAKSAEFDINSVPVSTATLGEFPYITLPQGYKLNGAAEDKRFARFPFWVNGAEHWVEGHFYLANIHDQEGKGSAAYAPLEVERSIGDLVKQLGGVQVGEGKIPESVTGAWGTDVTDGMLKGLGDVYNEPVKTWLIRRPEGNIWVHLVQNSAQGWLTIGQEKGFQQTATLLPASELKKQIDATGKVALQLNFATDKTDILPDSQPQLEQVVQLLQQDPALKLAVNGHTDNSGDKAHNQQLSEGRAKAVVAAMTAKGIDAGRLSAKGYGDTQPVADNGSEDGKAKNRRVELVRQ